MRSVFYYDYDFGGIERVGIADDEKGVTHVLFGVGRFPENVCRRESPLIVRAAVQLREYFAGKRREFDLPLSMNGTEFQLAVWNVLRRIPYGETVSYGWVAGQIGQPKAFRAVGGANNRNPIAIIVPCHRVIGADGKLVGYGGGLHIKEQLLALERKTIGSQVP